MTEQLLKSDLVKMRDGETVMFTILSSETQTDINQEKAAMAASIQAKFGEAFTLGNYTIASWNEYNSLPTEVMTMIKKNPYLPEVLKKKVRILYGDGPMLYKIEYKDNKKVRIPVTDQYPEVMNWLSGWNKNGMPSFREYIQQTIQNYFYLEGYYSQFLFNQSRKLGGKYGIPIRGLLAVNPLYCRLGFQGLLSPTETIRDEQCNLVIWNRWDVPYRFDYKIFQRFNPMDPLASPTVINLVRDRGFGEDIYPTPTSYYGLKEWIRGVNLNASYVNSYLKNSLTAKIHVQIPNAWIAAKEEALKKAIEENRKLEAQSKPILTEWEGVTIGTQFNWGIINKLIQQKIRDATEVLSGEGENQGKAFWSRTFRNEWGIEEWKFTEIPIKYKEFIESLIAYDKRALQVVLAGMGMDPAISNVSNEGVFNSGSQVLYAYLMYLLQQYWPEEIVTEDVQTAINVNFPRVERDGVHIGFDRPVPQKTEEVPPEDRIQQKVQ
jgi:hypothetical protein